MNMMPHTITQMATQTITHYDHPAQFEPLMPSEALSRPLYEKANDLMLAGKSLAGLAMANPRSEIRALLRSMNSYYTNLMEGEHTRPSEIEEALHADFTGNAKLARRQRLAVSHIQTEQECEESIDRMRQRGDDPTKWLYSTEALEWLHDRLFSGLSTDELTQSDGSVMSPGHVRTRHVAVGLHHPPIATSLKAFLDRWSSFYSGMRRGDVAAAGLAASHHRLVWVHPFQDGNGRVARLHTHLVLHSMGITGGLWSPLRGFARTEDKYKALLNSADNHRAGALDGRGNLTQKGLLAWMNYALDVCLDQVGFMGKQLDIQGMSDRIAAALTFDETTARTGVRLEALRPLHYLFATQAELTRAEFRTMTGLGDRVATSTLSALIHQGYLATDSAYGPVRFAVPRHALRFYFPTLWPEAEKDAALVEGDRRGDAPVPHRARRR